MTVQGWTVHHFTRHGLTRFFEASGSIRNHHRYLNKKTATLNFKHVLVGGLQSKLKKIIPESGVNNNKYLKAFTQINQLH